MNDAQRRVFAILHGLGPGPARRRGIAVLGDGFSRFGPVAGVICTPEAIAVLGACTVSGGDGYLFAPLRGAWTIGGSPAQIDGIGANPVYDVDGALKRIVAEIRRGGLDPGPVQSLIAVDGSISGVAQPETERGQGVVVTHTEPDAFVAGIDRAMVDRAAGLSGAWTTADVIGALQALGFDAADIDVEQLTKEGFAYSPYVLRPTLIDDVPFAREEPDARAVRPLRSHSAPEPTGDTAEGDQRPTGAIPAVTPPLADTPAAHAPAHASAAPGPLLPMSESEPERQRSNWRWLVPLVALLAVGAGVVIASIALFGSSSNENGADRDKDSAAASAEPPKADGVQSIGGYDFEPGPVDSQIDCAEHAYGDVQEYFAANPCTGLDRSLFLTEVDGKSVALSVVSVTMPDAAGAASLKSMTDTEGTGNVTDLLREGVLPDGYPTSDILVAGEYASAVTGAELRIVEAAFVDGSTTTPTVDAAADAALQLEF
ncbi:MAG: hypothetical protein ACK5MR_01600 [Cumulibacter sp.]